MSTVLRRLWGLVRHGLEALLALALIFEEWGWEPLHRVLIAIGRWPGFRQLEAWTARQGPRTALALFLTPVLGLLPVKLAALGLIAHGHAVLGVAVIVAAKLVGTAVVARLYALTQPALMQLAWFARWHPRWVAWKDGLLARVRASRTWRWGRALKRRLRRLWRPAHP